MGLKPVVLGKFKLSVCVCVCALYMCAAVLGVIKAIAYIFLCGVGGEGILINS